MERGSLRTIRCGKSLDLMESNEHKDEENYRLKTPTICTLHQLLLFRKNPDDGQSPKTQYLCVLYTIVRTL
jgi:hypothetical protein